MIEGGTVLSGRYRLGELIAQGGMGDVHSAEDVESGGQVCVKILRGTDPRDVQRFASESRMLDSLDHPLVVDLLGSGAHEHVPYLVMEYIDGPSMRDLMRDGPVDADQVRKIGRDVALALAHAHSAGIVHRDIKPANVLLDGSGDAHLADFGIARLADVTGLTATGTAIGTAAYLAPEQLLSAGDIGPSSDVYSLGLMLLEALTGEVAFTGTTTEAAFARIHRDPSIPEGVAPRWRTLFAAMTSRDPGQRPSADVVADALRPGGPYVEAILAAEATQEHSKTMTMPLPPHEPGPAGRGGRHGPRGGGTGTAVGQEVRSWLRSLRRPRAGAGVALVAAVAIAAVLAVAGGRPPAQTTADDDAAGMSETQLPQELERSLRELEEVVRP